MATAIAPKAPTQVHQAVMKRIDSIAQVLPRSIPSEKFARSFEMALLKTPDLNFCTPASVLLAVQSCAADGLTPDGREAALVVTKPRKKVNGQWVAAQKGEWVAAYWPMVQGMLKRARNSGEIASLHSDVVIRYELEHDMFQLVSGTHPAIIHKKAVLVDEAQAADIVGVYSVARLKDGTVDVEFMRRSDIQRVAKMSPSTDRQTGALGNVWEKNYSEMARKTVLRRHCKRLPMDSDLMRLFERVDDLYDLKAEVGAAGPARGVAAQRMAQLRHNPQADPETGELPDEQGAPPAGEEVEEQEQAAPKKNARQRPAPRQEAPIEGEIMDEDDGPDPEEGPL